MSLAMLTHWVCNVMIGQFFLAAVAKVGVSGVYCGFGVVCILAVLYIQVCGLGLCEKTVYIVCVCLCGGGGGANMPRDCAPHRQG